MVSKTPKSIFNYGDIWVGLDPKSTNKVVVRIILLFFFFMVDVIVNAKKFGEPNYMKYLFKNLK